MQVVLKIIQHCQEALPAFVTGQLLGLDIGRTLEVTNCFPFPRKDEAEHRADVEEDDDGAEYQMEMMRCLRDVNVDNNTVGWYQSTYLSSFIDESCIDTQFNYQVRPDPVHRMHLSMGVCPHPLSGARLHSIIRNWECIPPCYLSCPPLPPHTHLQAAPSLLHSAPSHESGYRRISRTVSSSSTTLRAPVPPVSLYVLSV